MTTQVIGMTGFSDLDGGVNAFGNIFNILISYILSLFAVWTETIWQNIFRKTDRTPVKLNVIGLWYFFKVLTFILNNEAVPRHYFSFS